MTVHTTSSNGLFLGYGKRLHLYNGAISALLCHIIETRREYLLSTPMGGNIAVSWIDRRGNACHAFTRCDRNGRQYCCVYRCMEFLGRTRYVTLDDQARLK